MKICRQCGKTTEIESNFCESCGGALTDAVACPHCGAAMPGDAAVCPACGKGKNDETNENSTPVAVEETVGAEAPGQKPNSKKKWTIIGAGVAAVIVVVGAIALLSPGKSSSGGEIREDLLYVSDGKLNYLRNDKGDSIRMAKDADYDSGRIIENGKTLLYRNGGTLYTLSLKGKDAKPKKVSNLYGYQSVQFSADGTVAYIDDDSELFFGPYEKPVSVDKDVDYFRYDVKSGSVWYRTNDNDLFFMPKGREPERASKDAGAAFISKDGKSILFGDDDGDIYIKKYGKDKEKLASDTNGPVFATDDLSTFYYLDEDEALCMQKGKKEPKVIYDDSCYVVEATENAIVFVGRNKDSLDLYFYDGKDYEEVEEDIDGASTDWTDDEFFIVSYSVDDSYGYMIVKDNTYRMFEELIGEDPDYFTVDDDTLYIMGEDSIYTMSLSGKLPEKAKKILDLPGDYDNYGSFYIFKDKPVFRGYDYDKDESVLYWNGVEVYDEDVYSVTVSDKYLYYITGEDDELYRFDGKKSELVIEDARDVVVVNDKVYCIADYSDKKYSGDLYNVTGNKPVKVTEDVEDLYTAREATKDKTNYLWW